MAAAGPIAVPIPRWFPAMLLGLTAILWMGWFSPEVHDSDFWWHLRTGQYLVEHRALPVPDPFSFTTATAASAYSGEELTRRFNLTHEWLAQVLFYIIYRAAGFAGLVVFRAALLTAFCALAGLVAHRRCGGFYRSWGASFAVAFFAAPSALDRPFLFTFVLLAATVAILEFRQWMWLLPVIFLVWANCHGGFFLGWIVLAVYGWRAPRAVLVPALAAVLVSGLNPNGFRVVEVLFHYRQSFLQSKLLEWAPPRLWPPGAVTFLLCGTAALLLWDRRRVSLADWLLFAAFAAAAVTAQRNVALLGFVAPVLLATYFPWKHTLPVVAQYAAAAAVLAALGMGIAGGSFFQLRAAEWRYPRSAADFLIAHHVTQPMFNTYEYGGYLIWRLWPQQRVFIDGRALSDAVFRDYGRILYNVEEVGGTNAQEVLDRYGIQVILMNTFEYSEGRGYLLAPALSDPQQTKWKLVYDDPAALIFMREPPPGIQALDPSRVFGHMEAECALHIEHEPQYTLCARSLGQLFARIGDLGRTRKWIGVYLAHPHRADPEAEDTYRRLLAAGQ